MRLIELTNTSDKDILDYPVDEYELNEKDELMDIGNGNFKKTGQTLTWTLKSGESAKFPFYVAEYLKKVYDFLKVGEETVASEAVTVEGGGKGCRKCGKEFKSPKGLALHLAHNHPELL